MFKLSYFDAIQDQVGKLSLHLPTGGVFNASRTVTTNLYALIRGLLNGSLLPFEQSYQNLMQVEMDPSKTVSLVRDWEVSVGIPDSCFGITGTLEQRRQQILLKLRGGISSTEQEWLDIADIFGVPVEFEHQYDPERLFQLPFPIELSSEEAGSRLVLIVHFPGVEVCNFELPFPLCLGDAQANIVQCIYERLKRSHIQLIFSYGTNAS